MQAFIYIQNHIENLLEGSSSDGEKFLNCLRASVVQAADKWHPEEKGEAPAFQRIMMVLETCDRMLDSGLLKFEEGEYQQFKELCNVKNLPTG